MRTWNKRGCKLKKAVAWLPGYILNKHLRKNSKARGTTKNGLVIYNVTWSLACIHAQLKRQTIELKGLQKYQDFFQRLIHTDSFFCFFGFSRSKNFRLHAGIENCNWFYLSDFILPIGLHTERIKKNWQLPYGIQW